MHSNMENVCLLSDGVRLLPNGEHFSEDVIVEQLSRIYHETISKYK